ncbi:MAG: hypothetical protein LBR78_01810 [Holosporales bacterium]|jgi:hypothetical protein|nr:hypothetical protein [Holosporales bacterium]
MNKLVLLSSMVMIGIGVVRGGEYHGDGGNLERERLALVVDITGDRDITGDEVGEGDEVITGEVVDEVEIGEVVERGPIEEHVSEMQGRVGALRGLLCRYEEREERLRKALNRLRDMVREVRGSSGSVSLTGIEERLGALEDSIGMDDEGDDVGSDVVVKRRERAEGGGGDPDTEEPTGAGVVPLSRIGTLHQKATTLIGGLDEIRGRIGGAGDGEDSETVFGMLRTLVARVTPESAQASPPPESLKDSIMKGIYSMLAWCGRYGGEADALTQFIYSTTENGSIWPITHEDEVWSWTTQERGSSDGTGNTIVTAAYIQQGEIQRSCLLWVNGGNETLLGSAIESAIPSPVEWAEVAVFRANGGVFTVGIDAEVQTNPKMTIEDVEIDWVPPIKDVLQSIVRGEEEGGYGTALAAGSWRAIIGTYTAPPAPSEEVHLDRLENVEKMT